MSEEDKNVTEDAPAKINNAAPAEAAPAEAAPAEAAPAEAASGDSGFKFAVGTTLKIPTHAGIHVAVVVEQFEDYSDACEFFDGSYPTILQHPTGKADEDQPHYLCEVANKGKKKIGVAEEHAEAK